MNLRGQQLAVEEPGLARCWADHLAVPLVDRHEEVGQKTLVQTQLSTFLSSHITSKDDHLKEDVFTSTSAKLNR